MAIDREMFPMDYEHEQFFSGELRVEPMGRLELESAMKAYDLFHGSITYPTDFRDKLADAWKLIYGAAPKTIKVTVKTVPDASASQPPAPPERFHVLTASRMIG